MIHSSSMYQFKLSLCKKKKQKKKKKKTLPEDHLVFVKTILLYNNYEIDICLISVK